MTAPSLRPRARLIVAAALLAGCGLPAAASPALATTTITQSQTVAGATVATVGLTLATVPALVGISPGTTATGTGVAAVVDTGPWTLSVNDQSTATTTGHLVAASTGCTGSEAALHNPLQVTAVGALGSVTPAGTVSLSGVPQPLATGTSSATVTTNYAVPILSSEPLITGCVYGLTAVYTLQG